MAEAAQETTPGPIMIGETSVQPLVTRDLTENLVRISVNFGPGARTKLHARTGGRVLVVTAGKGIVATEEKGNVVTPGTTVHMSPGERRWHAATAGSSFSHISITSPSATTLPE